MSMNKGRGKTVVTRMERRRMRARQRRIRICAVLLVLAVVVLTGSWVVIGAGKEISEADRSPQEIRVEALTVEAIEDGPEPVKLVEREEHQEGEDPLEAEKIEAALVEQGYFRDDVPLSYTDQDFLHTACHESGVPYALALAVIQKETGFNNVMGDDGASSGYMQVQERWHWDRMERLGVTDLMHPFGNFRVGCDYLAELLEKYPLEVALTAYNMGHYPGYTTQYALDVMGYYEEWKELVGDGVSGIKG